jgi:hypothetical protein
MPSPQIPRRCFVCTGHAKVQRSVTVELRDLFSRSPAFNGAWPGRSSYFTTSPCRRATCEATVESMCLSFAEIRIAPTTPIWTSAVFPTPDLWRSATPHALHRVRSPRRRRGAVLVTSWLIGRPVRSSTEITLDCRVSMLQRSMLPHSSSIACHSRRELWWIWLGHLSQRCCIP